MKGTLLKKTLVVIMTGLFLASTGAMAKTCPKGQTKDSVTGKCVKTQPK